MGRDIRIRKKRRKRGIALFLTLGFTTVLVMMLGATMVSSNGGNIFSQDYHRKTAALYAAETGLALLQEEFEQRLDADPDWGPANWTGTTPFGTGTFKVKFNRDNSVNNLKGTAVKDGPYGDVQPGTAFVRVEGTSRGQTEVIECVLGKKSEDFLSTAIVATGKIYLEDNVDISGRVSSDDHNLSQADIVSNYDKDTPWGGGNPPVYWVEVPGRNRLEGIVRSASPAGNSISPDLKSLATAAFTDQAPVPVINLNIQRAVNEKSSVPQRVPTFPSSALNGDYYESGDKTVAGDLILNSASLYVNGDLTVDGSIRGVGAVYVAGRTTFCGDAEVLSNEDGVVLYSQGNVHLKGFDGTLWMDTRAAAYPGDKTPEWKDTQKSFDQLRSYLKDFAANPSFNPSVQPAFAPPPGTPPMSDPTADDYYWRSPAGLLVSNLGTNVSYFRPPGITHTDLLSTMSDVVNAGLTSFPPFSSSTSQETQLFMSKKFRTLKVPHAFSDTGAVGEGALSVHNNTTYVSDAQMVATIEGYINGPEKGHAVANGLQLELILAAAIMHGETMGNARFASYAGLSPSEIQAALIKQAHWLDLYDFDKLGESYFQGNIYTRGAIYASNEVTIVGSLSAVDDPAAPDTSWNPVDRLGRGAEATLHPGDVYLAQGTRILHLSDLKPGPRGSRVPVGVRNWIR